MTLRPTALWLLFPVSALLLPLVAVPLSAQARTSAPNEVVWHWFGACASGDSLVLEVRLDGKAVNSSAFPICQSRRSEIQPEPQQRILEFRFDAAPKTKRRERSPSRATSGRPVGNEMQYGWASHSPPSRGFCSTRFTWLERILHLGLSGSAVS